MGTWRLVVILSARKTGFTGLWWREQQQDSRQFGVSDGRITGFRGKKVCICNLALCSLAVGSWQVPSPPNACISLSMIWKWYHLLVLWWLKEIAQAGEAACPWQKLTSYFFSFERSQGFNRGKARTLLWRRPSLSLPCPLQWVWHIVRSMLASTCQYLLNEWEADRKVFLSVWPQA